MDTDEFLRQEVLEIGRQESRNFRTTIILSGLLISSISLLISSISSLSKNNTNLIRTVVSSAEFMIILGLLMSSLILSYGVNLFRWMGKNFAEVEKRKLKNYLSIQRKLIAASRAALILSILIGFYAVIGPFGTELGAVIVIPVIMVILSLLAVLYSAWRIT